MIRNFVGTDKKNMRKLQWVVFPDKGTAGFVSAQSGEKGG